MTLGTTWTFAAALVIMTGLIAAQVDPNKIVYASKGGQAKLECALQGSASRCEFSSIGNDGTSNVMLTSYSPEKVNVPFDQTGVMMTMEDNLPEGICNLILDNVQPEIFGIYTCKIYDMEKKKHTQNFNLIVLAMPTLTEIYYNNIAIQNGTRYELPENGYEEPITLEVRAERGIPAATGRWEMDGVFDPPNGNQTVIDEPDNYKTTVGRLTIQISRTEPKPERSLTYTSYHEAYPDKSIFRTISIGYSYETRNAAIKQDKFTPLGQDTITQLTCIADGIPKPKVEWRWASDRDGQYETFKEQLNLPSTELNDQINTTIKGFYICCAQNIKNPACVPSQPFKVNGNDIPKTSDDQPNVDEAGTIAGIVIGSLVLVAIIVGLSVFTYRRNLLCFKGHEATTPTHNPSSVENGGKHQQTINSSEYTKDKDDGVKDHKPSP